MLDELIRQCKEKKIKEIIGYYHLSKKNDMVSDLYNTFGFKLISSEGANTIWSLNILNYKNKNKFIGIEE